MFRGNVGSVKWSADGADDRAGVDVGFSIDVQEQSAFEGGDSYPCIFQSTFSSLRVLQQTLQDPWCRLKSHELGHLPREILRHGKSPGTRDGASRELPYSR